MYEAYGIEVENLKWKKNASERLMERYLSDKNNAEVFAEYCKDNGYDPNSAEARKYFVEDYTTDTSYGIEGMLVDLINNRENAGWQEFVEQDYCIAVPATLPSDQKKKAEMLTEKDIRIILTEYLNDLLEEPATIQWLSITDN